MSSDLFGVCVNPPGNCPSCPGAGQSGVTINKPQFGETGKDQSFCRRCSKYVNGGLMNYKKSRMTASSFTLLKKSLTTFNPISAVVAKGTLGKGVNTGPVNSYTNVGGPGDQTASVPIRTGTASGIKARTIVQPHQTGVDTKHGSYERYLARKRGANMRCQNC